ncbi:MAG: hypothetical protein ACRDQ4_13620 [Pseudonocardiaceae bacterium]
MSIRTPLRDLPPHVRLLAWPSLNGHGDVPGVSVSVPSMLASSPPSLACCNQQVSVELPLPDRDLSRAETLLTDPLVGEALAEPVRLMCLLALWDEVIRQQDVYRGNIYLASDDAVASLVQVAGGEAPGDLGELLEQLHNLELLYRFPVAFKFRGTHGPERQCRANGWGRLLYRLMAATDAGPQWIEPWRERLTAHVRQYLAEYQHGVLAATQADDHANARVWEEIHSLLPVSVLI